MKAARLLESPANVQCAMDTPFDHEEARFNCLKDGCRVGEFHHQRAGQSILSDAQLTQRGQGNRLALVKKPFSGGRELFGCRRRPAIEGTELALKVVSAIAAAEGSG